MEGEERHAVGSAPALGSSSALAVESPTAAKAAAARSLFDSRAIPAETEAAEETSLPTLAAASVPPPPSMSHLPSPTKEGSLRGGNLFHSIAQGASRSNLQLEGFEDAGKGLENAGQGQIEIRLLAGGGGGGPRARPSSFRFFFFDGGDSPSFLIPPTPSPLSLSLLSHFRHPRPRRQEQPARLRGEESPLPGGVEARARVRLEGGLCSARPEATAGARAARAAARDPPRRRRRGRLGRGDPGARRGQPELPAAEPRR